VAPQKVKRKAPWGHKRGVGQHRLKEQWMRGKDKQRFPWSTLWVSEALEKPSGETQMQKKY